MGYMIQLIKSKRNIKWYCVLICIVQSYVAKNSKECKICLNIIKLLMGSFVLFNMFRIAFLSNYT